MFIRERGEREREMSDDWVYRWVDNGKGRAETNRGHYIKGGLKGRGNVF